MKKDKKFTKEEAITCYVLHLMMWDELARTGNDDKRETSTMMDHKAYWCEFCHADSFFAKEYEYEKMCEHCPSEVGGIRGVMDDCLNGLFIEWYDETDEEKRKELAGKIRDVELADWFKKLIE